MKLTTVVQSTSNRMSTGRSCAAALWQYEFSHIITSCINQNTQQRTLQASPQTPSRKRRTHPIYMSWLFVATTLVCHVRGAEQSLAAPEPACVSLFRLGAGIENREQIPWWPRVLACQSTPWLPGCSARGLCNHFSRILGCNYAGEVTQILLPRLNLIGHLDVST